MGVMSDLDVRCFNDNGDRVIVLAHGELGRDHSSLLSSSVRCEKEECSSKKKNATLYVFVPKSSPTSFGLR